METVTIVMDIWTKNGCQGVETDLFSSFEKRKIAGHCSQPTFTWHSTISLYLGCEIYDDDDDDDQHRNPNMNNKNHLVGQLTTSQRPSKDNCDQKEAWKKPWGKDWSSLKNWLVCLGWLWSDLFAKRQMA